MASHSADCRARCQQELTVMPSGNSLWPRAHYATAPFPPINDRWRNLPGQRPSRLSWMIGRICLTILLKDQGGPCTERSVISQSKDLFFDAECHMIRSAVRLLITARPMYPRRISLSKKKSPSGSHACASCGLAMSHSSPKLTVGHFVRFVMLTPRYVSILSIFVTRLCLRVVQSHLHAV
jgi:hypothetical protein